MTDRFGRTIDYLRISVTDRCNLRCTYCMPAEGVPLINHKEILTYEEILRIVSLLAKLGIKKVRITGGEPLVRKNLSTLVAGIKAIEGIEKVVLTTNGMLLSEQLPELVEAGLDGVNISIDAIEDDIYHEITRREGVERVLASIDDALRYPHLKVKLNCVPTSTNFTQIIPMVSRFLQDERLSLRFIELMPIGLGQDGVGISEKTLRELLESEYGELTPLPHVPTDGPCKYFKLERLPGKVGFISAVSNCFCSECNRIRLTSSGFLKTCLQYDRGIELRPIMGESDEVLLSLMQSAILDKPERHKFTETGFAHAEQHIMSQIGG